MNYRTRMLVVDNKRGLYNFNTPKNERMTPTHKRNKIQ